MGLDLFKLRVFVAVVEHKGFSAAAEHLGLSQGTVSFHVHSLERHLEKPLVRYEHRAVRLTDAGEQVYRSARRMLHDEQRLMRSIRRGHGEHLTLGASIAFEQDYFFTALIAPYLKANPQTGLSLRFGHSLGLAEAVADHRLDLAYVIGWQVPASLRYEPLHTARFTLLVGSDHSLARRETVTVPEVAEAGLITAPLDEVEWVHYEKVLREVGLTAEDSALEIDGMQARVLAAAAGLGVLGVFRPDYAGAVTHPTLHSLPLDRDLPTVEVGLVTRRADASDSHQALADWIRRTTSGEHAP
ncbi:regulatory helix-turn-helix protein, lysR family [Modestobacter sp. DSM 44400]|uniref:LysR family transcriptional regulator n=1 Tax=Modestobacter sp. DSM 44400 TaxID=1550230 RepID=UPI0008978484|nr:LysR family transcriptional regulator [Modestobacter sp. DSM 44400]SDY06115.1 regulatory helix-turn-helix protein, lysR family [Modestobacter sp. DSM 44400]